MAPPYRPQPPPNRGFLDELFPVDPRTVIGGLYDQGARGVGKAIDYATGQPVGEDFSSPTLGREAYQMLSSPTFGGGMSPMAGAATLAVGAPIARRLAAGGRTAAMARAAVESDAAAQAARAAASSPGQAALDAMTNASRQGRTAAARSMEDVPTIRGLPTAQAIEQARTQEHLIPAGAGSAGYFVGGPQDIHSPEALAARRAEFDAYIAPELRGADWYDRYRAGMNRATGGDPDMNRWMSNTQGSWSAGVSPQSETAFTIKEANSALAGQPARAYTGGPHQDFLDAIAAGDPDMMRLGPKTGEYASLVNPNQANPPGATGVNDFRMANQFGYTPGEATTRAGDVSLTAPQHRFMDYETALATDRANQAALGGRTDWTGEQLQAAPWVKQKALALMDQRPGLDYESAILEANKTAPDFFDKHAANATWEAQPGTSIPGHFPGSAAATPEERTAFMGAPGSWASAPSVGVQPGELPRDAVYGGLRLGDTGVGMYTLPSRPMLGSFEGVNNPGAAARPLVAFDTAGPVKTVSPADQALLNAGETTRSYFGAQDAGAWNKPWPADKVSSANSFLTPLDRPATAEELTAQEAAGRPHGLPMAVDTGGGILTTNFDAPPPWKPGERRAAIADLSASGPGSLMKTDSGYIPMTPAWQAGQGSGAATRQLLDAISQTPEMREAFNRNPYIPPVASAIAERDASMAPASWGAPRADIQNARLMAGEGPGWVDRLQQGLEAFNKTGKLPALGGAAAGGAAMFTPTAGLPATLPGQGPQYDDWWSRMRQGGP